MVSQIPISSSQLASQQVVGYKRPSQQVSAWPQTKSGMQGIGLVPVSVSVSPHPIISNNMVTREVGVTRIA